jgi:hypothetical protein
LPADFGSSQTGIQSGDAKLRVGWLGASAYEVVTTIVPRGPRTAINSR